MLPITKMPIKFNFSKSVGRVIKYIVLHDTGNPAKGAGVDNHYSFFNGQDRQSSADFFVDDHKIGQFNPDLLNCYTWHCGDGAGKFGITNGNSVGVEICIPADGNYIQAVINAVGLVQYLMKLLNIDLAHLVRHKDASGKLCPATMSANNWAKWNEFKTSVSYAAPIIVKEVFEMDACVVYFTPADYSVALILSNLNGGCAMYCRNGSATAHKDVAKAKKIFTVGGGKLGVAGEIYLSGNDGKDTLIAVANYLK